jgi:hypothetical protein
MFDHIVKIEEEHEEVEPAVLSSMASVNIANNVAMSDGIATSS